MSKYVTLAVAGFAIVLCLGVLLSGVIGTPISSDLSVVGKGKPALVLVYENYSPTGGEALNRLGDVKSDYESQIDFIVADLGVPEGRSFADRHRLVNAQALFLASDGRPHEAISVPADEGALRRLLDDKLAQLE
jgi:hypothetical protein